MRRREFIALLGSAAVVQPRNVLAQQPNRARRIGVLMELAANDIQARSNIAALQRGLQTLGWQEGSNLGVDYRWAADDPVLLWKFARELVQLRPDVLVAASSPVVGTLLGETRNIPIVFVSISDPIGENFVANFAYPGGNVTGFTNFESSMTGKWVELLTQIAPGVTRVAFLFNPQAAAGGGSYFLHTVDAAVSTLKCKLSWRWFMTVTRSKRHLWLLHASPVLVRLCCPTSSWRLIIKRSSLWQHTIMYRLFIHTVLWWSGVA